MLRFSNHVGWADVAYSDNIQISDGTCLRLGRDGQTPIAATEPFGSFGGRSLPSNVAIAPDGRLFVADANNGVILSALASECIIGAPPPFSPLWDPVTDPTDAYHLSAPTAVRWSAQGDLVIADPVAGKVLVLCMRSGRVRQDLRLTDWAPSGLAQLGCGTWLVTDTANARIKRFDAAWQPLSDWPRPDGALDKPTHICAVAQASDDVAEPVAYVMDRNQLVALDRLGRITPQDPQMHIELTPPALFVADTEGGLGYRDPHWPDRAPLHIANLAMTRDGRLLDTSAPVMARPRRIEVPPMGHVIFAPFDSGQRGFAWDRIGLDLTMPPHGRITIRTYTTDTPVTPDRIQDIPTDAWSVPLTLLPGNIPDVLIQSAKGRYLLVRIDLFSDGRTSPNVSRLDLFGPRKSGLTHLPAPFHQDPESRHFLDRFLSYFDTVFAELRQQSRDIGVHFDPRAVPADRWLEWLGSWFDISFLAEWDEATRREMVAHAIDTARDRGTKAGLAQMLRWHLGLEAPWPAIVENWALGPDAPTAGHVPMPTEPEPHKITIFLPRALVPTDQETRLSRLIGGWCPAHVDYDLRFLEPGLIIGSQSIPGVDAYLGASTAQPLGIGRAGIDLGISHAPRGTHFNTTPFSQNPIGACHAGQGH